MFLASHDTASVTSYGTHGSFETQKGDDSHSGLEHHNPKRWFVLLHNITVMILAEFVFFFYSAMRQDVQASLGIDFHVLFVFGIWHVVGFFVAFFPVLWLLNRYSVKVFASYAAVGTFLAAFFQCMPYHSTKTFMALAQAAVFLKTISTGAQVYYTVAIVDEYFPEAERNLAMSSAITIPQLGMTLTYLFSYLIVPKGADLDMDPVSVGAQIRNIRYGVAVLAFFTCFGAIFYPKGPLVGKAVRHIHRREVSVMPSLHLVKDETKEIFKSWVFWFVALRYNFTTVNFFLDYRWWPMYMWERGISHHHISIVLALSGILVAIFGVVIGRLCDVIPRKQVKTVMFILSLLYFIGCVGTLMARRDMPRLEFFIFLTEVASNASLGPVFSVGTAELQVTEVTTGSYMYLTVAFIAVLFYIITAATGGSVLWLSYYQAASSACGVLLSLAYLHI